MYFIVVNIVNMIKSHPISFFTILSVLTVVVKSPQLMGQFHYVSRHFVRLFNFLQAKT